MRDRNSNYHPLAACAFLLLQLMVLAPAAYGGVAQCTFAPDNMVSWWGGDNNTLDMVGTNHATLMNGATYAAGMVGEAFSFDGASQYVEVPDSTSLHIPTAITLDAWINTADPSKGQMVISKAQNIWNWASYAMQISSTGKLVFEIDKWSAGHYGVWMTDSTLAANTWHHVAVTWQNVYGDARDAKLYINGLEQTAPMVLNQGYDSTVTLEYDALPLFIGRDYTGNYFFNGSIDEVEIFDRILSSSEIAAIYNAGSAGKCRSCTAPPANMVSWWDGEGNANDIVGTNNGALINGTTFAAGKIGQAFSFDGADDYIFVPNALTIDGGLEATYDAWVFPKADPGASWYDALFGAGDATQSGWGPHQCRVLYFSTQGSPPGTAKFYVDCACNDNESTVNRTSAHDYPINSWHMVAAVFNNGNLDLYVNGVLDNGTTSGPLSPGSFINRNASNYVWMGALLRGDQSVAAAHFNGLLDEVEIFNRALSADEIAMIYNAGSAGKCKPAVTLGPDLTGKFGKFVFRYGVCKGSLTVSNIGDTDAGVFNVTVFQSYDGKTPMTNLSNKRVAGLTKGASAVIPFPYSVWMTEQYIIAIIDKGNRVDEPDETNNRVMQKIP